MRRRDGNLVIEVATGESITVHGMFNTEAGEIISTNAIQQIEFDNAEMWDLNYIQQESGEAVQLIGTQNNDLLTGYDSDDMLIGNQGADKLQGGSGNDGYHFAIGDGADRIEDNGGQDTIYFAEGVTESQVTLRKDTNNNLIIRFNNNDSIMVLNAANDSFFTTQKMAH